MADLTDQPAQELEAFELRILNPAEVRVFRAGGVTRLTLENHRSWTRAQTMRGFPLSDPDHYIGFLDSANKDIGLVIDPSQLDPESRLVVDQDLEKRYFVPLIRKVYSVKEEFGTIAWDVDTDKGRRELLVRNIRDNLQELTSSRVIVTDVDGNRFEFPDISRLDSRTQGIILRNL